MPRKAIIIGAGPAGLTAAYELLKRTDIVPIVLEKSADIGGISKTVNYKGNRMDIGGHRFFSKSDRVMKWWLNILPVEPLIAPELTISYQGKKTSVNPREVFPRESEAEGSDKIMLVRNRLSRIYFLRKFFTYPISLSLDTLRKLGLGRTLGILLSYGKARLFPQKQEKSLEDFFINRFGNKLYRLFFKDYTEKVWGVSCKDISAEWGAQRVKGISIAKAIAHAAKSLKPKRRLADISQKNTETSLIERFLYPKFGPGQLWEEVARQVKEMGGSILMQHEVKRIITADGQVTAIETCCEESGETFCLEGDYFFSTMPVQELIAGMGDVAPANVRDVASGLQYRDFITVGVLLKKISAPEEKQSGRTSLPDTWIYIQERDVKVGRLQIFNNWSPFMVKDPDTVWVGMEYFCNKTDEFWLQSDESISSFAIAELDKMGLASVDDALDSTVLRMEKTYPAYFGSYERFGEIREFVDQFPNLFLVGRNGMHKYNNSDHSMLTAIVSVDNIAAGITEKANIWSINTEQEYHEEKAAVPEKQQKKAAPLIPAMLKDYVQSSRFNRTLLWFAVAVIVIQLVIFKFLYPFASFINGDSYVYLQSAFYNLDINVYPVGYPKFIRIFSTFTKSDTALVAFQYFAITASSLLFLLTLFSIFKPGKTAKIIILSIILLNPAFLHLANMVSSDALFFSLTILWFTTLLWILISPANNLRLLILHAILILFAFMVRYNALYYPILSVTAFLLSRFSWKMKIGGIALTVLFLGTFILYTSHRYYTFCGIKQFSPFSGWQMANNALYAYRYVDSAHVKKVPRRFQELDNMVRHYFDTSRDLKKHPAEALLANTVYMWDQSSPLQHFMIQKTPKDSSLLALKSWALVAPLYADYGKYLISQYPATFLKFYILPNAFKYYAPPGEFLSDYNMGSDTVGQLAKFWFRYSSQKVTTAFKNYKIGTISVITILYAILNILFLGGIAAYSLLKMSTPSNRKVFILIATLWVMNFCFSIFASPIALRFQLFGMLIFGSLAVTMLESICRSAFSVEQHKVPNLALN